MASQMKRIIVCCDGTWQNIDERPWDTPTNVSRFHDCVQGKSDNGIPQVPIYIGGVGTGNQNKGIVAFLQKRYQGVTGHGE